jgi:tetratricopeptide (TPR) repeat protein
MSEQHAHITLAELKDLFYRSRFNEVLKMLAKAEESAPLQPEFQLIRANTLFELHKVGDAKAILAQMQVDGDPNDPQYMYASARLCYFDNRLAEAKALFSRLVESDCSMSLRFKGLLGVTNTLYTMKDFSAIPGLLQELLAFEPLENEDEKLSLLIFLGNYYFVAGDNYALAKDYFRKAMSGAASRSWTYFIVRSLIGLATVCEKEGQHSELSWTLNILQAFIDNRWIAFHEKPLLFRFLLMLHENEMFVSKKQIATALWSDEKYKPRIHDPRIFDIAKRARSMIEAYDKQPVVLLSGRMGYKLASI